MELLMESSLQDLIAIFMPYMGILAVILITLSLVYDPTMTIFLYSMMPEGWKTWPWFMVALMEEIRSMTIALAVAFPAFQIHVIAFDLVNQRLENAVSNSLER